MSETLSLSDVVLAERALDDAYRPMSGGWLCPPEFVEDLEIATWLGRHCDDATTYRFWWRFYLGIAAAIRARGTDGNE